MASPTRTVADVVDLVEVRRIARSGEARAIRERAGLSLREVASAVGVTRSALQRWETGTRAPGGELAGRYGALLAALEASSHE